MSTRSRAVAALRNALTTFWSLVAWMQEWHWQTARKGVDLHGIRMREDEVLMDGGVEASRLAKLTDCSSTNNASCFRSYTNLTKPQLQVILCRTHRSVASSSPLYSILVIKRDFAATKYCSECCVNAPAVNETGPDTELQTDLHVLLLTNILGTSLASRLECRLNSPVSL